MAFVQYHSNVFPALLQSVLFAQHREFCCADKRLGLLFLVEHVGVPSMNTFRVLSLSVLFGVCCAGLDPASGQESRVDVDEFFKDAYQQVAKLNSSSKEELKRPVTMPDKLPDLPEKFRFEETWQDGTKCGAVSLYVVLSLEGSYASYQQVDEALPDHPEGNSMAELQNAATKFGLELRPVVVTPEELRKLPMPCIVHWSIRGQKSNPAGHFDVLLQHADDFGYDIVNTTHCMLGRIPYHNVAPQFDGYALIPVRAGHQYSWSGILWILVGAVVVANVAYAGFLFLTR